VNVWKVILATALIFGAGVIVGGLLVNYAGHSAFNFRSSINFSAAPAAEANSAANAKTNAAPKTVLPEVVSKRFVDVLQTNLHLSVKQRADIEKLIVGSQENVRQTFQDERRSVREKIRTLLNPAQQKELDEMLRQHAAKRAQQNATNAPAASKKTD
jgi:hypothetical protein